MKTRSDSLPLGFAFHKPFYIQGLGQMVSQNLKEQFCPAGDGSFQFFPKKILFQLSDAKNLILAYNLKVRWNYGRKTI